MFKPFISFLGIYKNKCTCNGGCATPVPKFYSAYNVRLISNAKCRPQFLKRYLQKRKCRGSYTTYTVIIDLYIVHNSVAWSANNYVYSCNISVTV